MICAEQSPRECPDGSIRWYEGDTFELIFEINILDENNLPIPITSTDTIEVSFRDKHNTIIHKFIETGSNVITMGFTEEISKKFKVGEYRYCTRYRGDYIKTIMRKNKVVVE